MFILSDFVFIYIRLLQDLYTKGVIHVYIK